MARSLPASKPPKRIPSPMVNSVDGRMVRDELHLLFPGQRLRNGVTRGIFAAVATG